MYCLCLRLVLVNLSINTWYTPLRGVFVVFATLIVLSVLLLLSPLRDPLLFSFTEEVLFFIPLRRLSDFDSPFVCCWDLLNSSDFDALRLLFRFTVLSCMSLLFAVVTFVLSMLWTALFRFLKKLVFSRNKALRAYKNKISDMQNDDMYAIS